MALRHECANCAAIAQGLTLLPTLRLNVSTFCGMSRVRVDLLWDGGMDALGGVSVTIKRLRSDEKWGSGVRPPCRHRHGQSGAAGAGLGVDHLRAAVLNAVRQRRNLRSRAAESILSTRFSTGSV